MRRIGTHLTDLSAAWGPSGRWFKSSRPDLGAKMRRTANPRFQAGVFGSTRGEELRTTAGRPSAMATWISSSRVAPSSRVR